MITDSHIHNELTVSNILDEAWHSVRGIKWSIFLAMLTAATGVIVLTLCINWLIAIDTQHPPFLLKHLVMPILTNALAAPLYTGAVMVAIQRVRLQPTPTKIVFSYFKQYIPLAFAMIIIGLLASLIFIFINVPSISRQIGHAKSLLELIAGLFSIIIYAIFLLTHPLIAEKKLSTISALRESTRLTKQHWHKIAIALLIGYFVVLVCFIPATLGFWFHNTILIILGVAILLSLTLWLLPFLFLIIGVTYRHLVDNKLPQQNDVTT